MATRAIDARDRWQAGDFVASLRHLDYLLLAAVAALVAYGLWVLDTVTPNDVAGEADYYVVRQAIAVGLGGVLLLAAALADPERLGRFRTPLYALALGLLAVVLVTAEVRGSRRWLELGFFRFQPSEVGKVVLAIVLAGFLADRGRRVVEARSTLGALALAACPTALVFIEPDFGTALVYGALTVAALFVAGTRWSHLAGIGVALVLAALAVLWLLPSAGVQVLQPYQVDRLVGFRNPDADPSGSTYNVNQSITAAGSGGLDGRGVQGATQTNLNYLPEHATDFIFASIAEQRGFLGAALLLGLYAIVIWRGIKIIALAPSLFMATLAGALVFAFLFQVFVNVGMTIGLAPVTGIPLPFVSYGGSSMVATLVAIGLLQAIHVRGRLAGR